ncbi:M20 family metallo-hydrolase [Crassaminicella profunda]|uniref:M20 family metallo-hydrolase n=1 Tax=Crassaminicella profunda TaxID=1286698 RepID=UPI001CA79E34|nr:M20 family metallo-hydrolase [Crassaminicella profunda]QZY54409.1 M20 family metallo-hydrolase [Crassaminicella profunda]
MYCNAERIEEMLQNIATFTVAEDEGFTRFSYTQEDIQAKKYIIKKMKEANLKVSMDLLGNIFGRREGTEENLPPIVAGSHLDTVKNGGKYDGIAGIVAGIEALRVMEENQIKTKYPIEVVAFAEEEGGRFNSAFIGSSWFMGKIKEEALETICDHQNMSLKEAAESLNVFNEEIKRCKRKDYHIKAMIELHCEQGPILENNQKSLGLVNAIIGSSSYQVTLFGQADHSGTTPMDVRKDAFYAASKIAVELNEFTKKQEMYSVGTVGCVEVKPNVYNIVPQEVSITMDIRSMDQKVLEHIITHMKEYIEKIAIDHHIQYKIKKNHHANPVKLSNKIVDLLIKNTKKRNYNFDVMGSGAGHDTLIMAEFTDAAMIFIPSKNGRSHCPEEYSDSEHIAKGADVLLDTIIDLGEKVSS